jgi:hypothetical protein
VRYDAHEPFRLKPAKRLSNRRTTYAQRFAQFPLNQPRPWSKPSEHDRLAKHVLDLMAQGFRSNQTYIIRHYFAEYA